MYHANIFTVSADQANFGGANFFVRARAGVTLRRRIMRSAGYGFDPLMVLVFRARNLTGVWKSFKVQPLLQARISCAIVAFVRQDPGFLYIETGSGPFGVSKGGQKGIALAGWNPPSKGESVGEVWRMSHPARYSPLFCIRFKRTSRPSSLQECRVSKGDGL
ncbi:hypothetical protein [Phaeobacter sp. 11ANDIMAR09]|uniref:hypothetical protein n=1 Tax=Phaeobacter sp. 11ANDIMAR09 TaxID=1225647 RepID=UPI0020A1E793|nr:hypothetical protein [Phaeobacter sp. 11ANDIMAR09]